MAFRQAAAFSTRSPSGNTKQLLRHIIVSSASLSYPQDAFRLENILWKLFFSTFTQLSLSIDGSL